MEYERAKHVNDVFLIRNFKQKICEEGKYVCYEVKYPFLADFRFVQENEVFSMKNVLRGMGYQKKYPQGKLINVVEGAVYDVVVDLRKYSVTYGKWEGFYLGRESNTMLWIPPGFAHGYLVLEDNTKIIYKCTEYYHAEDEGGFVWNDHMLNIHWPVGEKKELIINKRDKTLGSFEECFKYN